MSLTGALGSPRTPIRRFLDYEMGAGSRLLRANFRARLTSGPLVRLDEEIRLEAGAVGTGIDHRLRLAFTRAPAVPGAALLGIQSCTAIAQQDRWNLSKWPGLARTGLELVTAIEETASRLDLDNRAMDLDRGQDEEELARLLLLAAWYAVLYRAPMAFDATPLWEAATSLTDLSTALAAVDPRLVHDLLAQVEIAAGGDLNALRLQTSKKLCCPDATFAGSADLGGADADIIVDGLLLDFKSTARPAEFQLRTIQQLLGYVLLDYDDAHTIDSVGVYLSRVGDLVTWPIEEYLDFLGIRGRGLDELRVAFRSLCQSRWDVDQDPLPEDLAGIERVLARLRVPRVPGRCPVCCGELPAPTTGGWGQVFCSPWCRGRSKSIRWRAAGGLSIRR